MLKSIGRCVIIGIAILLGSYAVKSQPLPRITSGTVIRHAHFPSRFVEPRHVDVWLPEGYPNVARSYDVIYFHDGQMLFDSSTTWNHQSWEADKTMSRLQKEDKIKPCIIVGVWNVPERRYANYFPQKIIKAIPPSSINKIMQKQIGNNPNADNYLAFLVRELKPFIDSTYAVYREADHTFIAGSSMGGLISLYGLCEYPEIFGGAACLSIHSPVAAYSLIDENTDKEVASTFREYLMTHLPEANTKKIYMDFGDQSGDAFYAPYQGKIDAVMEQKGYNASHWTTRFFKGESHTEVSWAKRLDIPILFLLKK